MNMSEAFEDAAERLAIYFEERQQELEDHEASGKHEEVISFILDNIKAREVIWEDQLGAGCSITYEDFNNSMDILKSSMDETESNGIRTVWVMKDFVVVELAGQGAVTGVRSLESWEKIKTNEDA